MQDWKKSDIGNYSDTLMLVNLYGDKDLKEGMEKEWCPWAQKCSRPTL